MEDRLYQRLFERIQKFEQSHTKKYCPEKGKHIRCLYRRLKEVEDKSQMGVKSTKDWITIRIISKYLVSCDEVSMLNHLIGAANACFIKRTMGGFVITLHFRLWRWIEKN